MKTHDIVDFVARVIEHAPRLSIYARALAAEELMRLGRIHGRLCTEECNRELREDETRRLKRTRTRIVDTCTDLGVKARLGGDPRGYTVKIIFPGKNAPYNTWGGASEGYGVPGS